MLAVDADAFLEADLLDLEEVGVGLAVASDGVEEVLVFAFMNSSINSFLVRERRRSFSWAGGSGGRAWERRRSSVSVW